MSNHLLHLYFGNLGSMMKPPTPQEAILSVQPRHSARIHKHPGHSTSTIFSTVRTWGTWQPLALATHVMDTARGRCMPRRFAPGPARQPAQEQSQKAKQIEQHNIGPFRGSGVFSFTQPTSPFLSFSDPAFGTCRTTSWTWSLGTCLTTSWT